MFTSRPTAREMHDDREMEEGIECTGGGEMETLPRHNETI